MLAVLQAAPRRSEQLVNTDDRWNLWITAEIINTRMSCYVEQLSYNQISSAIKRGVL